MPPSPSLVSTSGSPSFPILSDSISKPTDFAQDTTNRGVVAPAVSTPKSPLTRSRPLNPLPRRCITKTTKGGVALRATGTENRVAPKSKLGSIRLRSNLTDGDPSRWRQGANTELTVPNMKGLTRIDNPIANAKLPRHERKRRHRVVEKIFRKLGTGVRKARKQAGKGNAAQSSASQKSRTNEFEPKTFRLEQLPANITLWQIIRRDGIKTARERNIYICGSRVGYFRSTVSYLPHLVWIDRGMREDEPCTCVRCDAPRSRKGRRGAASSESDVDDTPASASKSTSVQLSLFFLSTLESDARSPTRFWIHSAPPPPPPVLIPLGRANAGQRKALLAQTSRSFTHAHA